MPTNWNMPEAAKKEGLSAPTAPFKNGLVLSHYLN